jgi:hypothetical protein
LNRNHSSEPPWDFLFSASRNSLQSYELSRLNHAANLGKEIKQLLDSYIEESSNARLARLLMEHPPRDADAATQGAAPSCAVQPAVSDSVSDNFLVEQGTTRDRN